MELRSTAYMWRVIENCLPAKIKTEVKGMTMFEDRYVSITMSSQRTGLKTHAKAPQKAFCIEGNLMLIKYLSLGSCI